MRLHFRRATKIGANSLTIASPMRLFLYRSPIAYRPEQMTTVLTHRQADKPRRIIVVIPAKDEAERIGEALLALDAAAACTPIPVFALVLANNCADDTADVAREAARQLRHCMLETVTVELPDQLAHAGGARRRAVAQGIRRYAATSDDIIVSTDADARLRRDALWRIWNAISQGDDLVLAKIECVTDPLDPVPEDALDWGRPGIIWRHCVRRFVETVLSGRVASSQLHDDYGGAGIAVRVDAYHRLGGFSPIACNEDLEFVRAADRRHMRVNRHSGVVVDVLARAQGRARGGMADALRHCVAAARQQIPCRVEHHTATIRRILRNPSHAYAFATEITEWECAADAISGLEDAIAAYGHRS
ncbi:MAG: glycosyltransferase family 2 protein [Hyphomicrobiaceae bacterium]